MKKIIFLATTLSIIMSQTACFGGFELTKKVYEFNQDASDNKFIKSGLFWVLSIVPVYQVAGVLDVFVFNLIDFWTGSNPLAMNENDCEDQFVTIDKIEYKITATKNHISFFQVNDNDVTAMGELEFNPLFKSWNFKNNGISNELGRFNSMSQTFQFNNEKEISLLLENELALLINKNR